MSTSIKNYAKYMHMIITLSLMLFVRYIPPFGGITELGMEVLGVFIGLVYAWIFCGLIWPSFLGLIMLGLSDYGTVLGMFAEGAGNGTVLFIFFLYIFVGAIDASGLMSVIGQFFVSLKIAQGKPYILMALMLFSAWVIGALVSAVAASILMWQVFYGMCDFLGYKKGDKYAALMIFGIFYAGLTGATVFPFKTYSIIPVGFYSTFTGNNVNVLQFSVLAVCVTLIGVLCYILMCKYIFRPETSKEILVVEKPGKLTTYQMKIAVLLFTLVAAYFSPSIFPNDWTIIQLLNDMGSVGIMASIVILCMVIQDGGKPLLEAKSAIHRGMSWEVYFMCMAAFPMVGAISSPLTGISTFIVDNMSPIFMGHSPMVFCFFIILVGGLLMHVVSNGVAPVIMLSIMIPLAADSGVDLEMMVCLMSIIMQSVIVLPSGTPVVGILLNNDWITQKEIYKYGGITFMLVVMVITVVGMNLGSIIY